MQHARTYRLPMPADDLLTIGRSYLKPGADPEHLVEALGRRPSLEEVEAARYVRGLRRSDRVSVGDSRPVAPMGPGESPLSRAFGEAMERKREKRHRERQRRKAKRAALGLTAA